MNGSRTDGRPFVETDAPAPVELYARSKWEAEEMLRGQTAETGVETVVLRPPLVYGPGVKGNFLRLLRLASSGLPLPLGSIRNRRNLVGVQNLCDLLILCTDNPRAAGQMYLAADPDVHSTADLIRALCRGLNRPCRLLPVPEAVVRGIARVTGFEDQFNKLCGSLEVCSDKARNELGWTPRARFDEEIARTTAWFLGARASPRALSRRQLLPSQQRHAAPPAAQPRHDRRDGVVHLSDMPGHGQARIHAELAQREERVAEDRAVLHDVRFHERVSRRPDACLRQRPAGRAGFALAEHLRSDRV